MKSFSRLREETNVAGADFLFIELDTGFTFMDVADTTKSAETRTRNRENAHVAYQCLLRYRPRVTLETNQQMTFDIRLAELKRRLLEAGFAL